jgi:hypothetical protein
MPVRVVSGGSGGAAWGGITGTLADQADLQTALDGKQASGSYAADTHDHDAAYEPKNANIQAHVVAAHAPSNAQKNSDITKAEIEAKLTGEIDSHSHASAPGGGVTLAEVIAAIYPVNSLKFSEDNVNPGTYLSGTTWELWGPGRVLVCCDANDTDFDTAGEERGTKTVAAAGAVSQPTLTINALSGGIRKGGTSNPGSIIENGNVPTGTVSQPTFTGTATSIVQPSKVGFMWKRTA